MARPSGGGKGAARCNSGFAPYTSVWNSSRAQCALAVTAVVRPVQLHSMQPSLCSCTAYSGSLYSAATRCASAPIPCKASPP